jgi:uncharacterized Zn-binding protein involved in type VI secretion
MGSAATRRTDTVTGLDTHIVMVPAAAGGTVPTSIPGHPFSGTITSKTSPDVTIDGLAATTKDSEATNDPKHIPMPPGVSFQKTPSNKGTVSKGSDSVTINGKAAARRGDPVKTCNDPQDLDAGTIMSGSGTVTIG